MKTAKESVARIAARYVEIFSELTARTAVGKSIMPLGYEVEEPKELLPKKTK